MSTRADRRKEKTAALKIAEKRVARGAAFLDKRTSSWARRVREIGLDMGSCYMCILGQLYGGYGEGLTALKIRSEKTQSRLGFDASIDDKTHPHALTQAWAAEIKKRRHV